MTIQHSELGASSAHRWMNCPASVKLSRGVKKESSSASSIAGTEAHARLENAFRRYLKGEEILTQAVNESEAKAFNALMEIWSNIKGLRKAFIEEWLCLQHLQTGMFGTCDYYFEARDEGKLYVIDFKNGVNEVEVEENVQLMYYALGILYLYGKSFTDIATVELIILQPNSGEELVKRQTKTAKEIIEWGKVLQDAAIETTKNVPKIASGDWCQYCPAKETCPLLAREIVNLSDEAVSVLPHINDIPTQALTKFIKAQEIVENSFATVKKELIRRSLEDQEEIDGFEVRSRKSARAWSDPEEVIKKFEKYGEELYLPRKLKSPTQLEEVILKEDTETYLDLQAETGEVYVLKELGKPRKAKNSKANDKSGISYVKPTTWTADDEFQQ